MTKVIKSVTVTPAQLVDMVKTCINAKVNLLIEGDKGVGKTDIVSQVCKQLDVPLFTTRLADAEPTDLRGLGMIAGKDDDGNPIMRFSRPDDIPPKVGKCVWFLDEITRANRGTVNAVMQATDNTKRVGSHKLSTDMVVIAATNPSSSEYDVQDMDAALLNRFIKVIVTPDVDSIIEYATSQDWDKTVLAFMKATRSGLFAGRNELGIPSCTPRSLERLSHLTPHLRGLRDKTQAMSLIQGCIGPELGTEFYAFLFEKRPVAFQELMEKDGQERLAKLCKEDGYRADLLSLTIDSTVEYFQNRKDVDKHEAAAVIFLLTTMQTEQSASAIKTFARKCPQVLLHKDVSTSKKLVGKLGNVA